jgi:hypothetical protein
MGLFANATDLAALLQRTFDATDNAAAAVALRMATAAIKNHTKQTIEQVVNDQVDLQGNWSHKLWLPERPVTAVSAVSIIGGSGFVREVVLTPNTDFVLGPMGLLRRVSYITGRLLTPASGYWGGDMAIVRPIYTHGFPTIPDDINAVCLSVASRLMSNPEGLLRESIDSQGVSLGVMYGRTSVAEITDGEAAQLDRYGPWDPPES